MSRNGVKQRILILGGSGFIGNALYRELHPFFDVHATYCRQQGNFSENRIFHNFCTEKDSLFLLLTSLRPTVIISASKSISERYVEAHRQIAEYILLNPTSSLLFISSFEVFDAKWQLPSYESDIPLSQSASGKMKITVEKLLMEQIPQQTAILRLPMVLGINSPIIFHLRQCIRHQATFEVYPNVAITATTIRKVCQQIHYIINKSLRGIYHLASTDMIAHEDLFREITAKMGDNMPIFKSVFSSNDISYNAILPSRETMPKHYQITVSEVIEESSLNEEIVSIK